MIRSPALATIKLPLSHRVSVQQQSLGDIIIIMYLVAMLG